MNGNAEGLKEYRAFIKEFLLPIIGISYNNNLIPTNVKSDNSDEIRQEGDKVIFSAFGRDVAWISIPYSLPDDIIAVGKSIIGSFFRVSRYNISTNSSVKLDYQADDIYQANIKLAIQKGICDWCAGGNNDQFHRLIHILEQWAVQTYEGKKVTFGFIFNPSIDLMSTNEYGTWLDFLSDDYAATLSDCIHSVIELDKNCNFSRYLSVTDGGIVSEYSLNSFLPYRFANVIQKYVKGDAVGVFLLNNGDIVLSKNQSVQFIKRNLKWLNMSYKVFKDIILAKFKRATVPEDLLEQVYASTLDVSFSHTGGIISVIRKLDHLIAVPKADEQVTKPTKALPILNPCDNLLYKKPLDVISSKMDEVQKNAGMKPLRSEEKQKRLLKREIVDALVCGRKFIKIDRKLRADLIAMDGACILDTKGNICAVGAIIQNDSGSSGGGRSAAAKKISNYGLAVKISTDGYIELFVEGEPVYAVK